MTSWQMRLIYSARGNSDEMTSKLYDVPPLESNINTHCHYPIYYRPPNVFICISISHTVYNPFFLSYSNEIMIKEMINRRNVNYGQIIYKIALGLRITCVYLRNRIQLDNNALPYLFFKKKKKKLNLLFL